MFQASLESKTASKCCLAVHLDLSREPKKNTYFLFISLKKGTVGRFFDAGNANPAASLPTD